MEKIRIFRHDSIDSTNSECFRKFDQKESLPFVVVAKTQTQGRGQFGRTWYSRDAKNLYISFGFVPRQTPQEFQNFSMVIAKEIADRLQSSFAIQLTIKPPNDIYGDGRKLCGILTESRVFGEKIVFAVVGIGLNVAGDLSKFPNGLRLTATTLSRCCGQDISLSDVEAMIIEVMMSLLFFLPPPSPGPHPGQDSPALSNCNIKK